MSRSRSEGSGAGALVAKGLVVAGALSVVALASVFGCHRHGNHGERMKEFVSWRIEKMLKEVDATPEQQERVMAIVDELVADLTAVHDDRADLHEVLVAQLTAEKIDRSALEAIRAEKMEKLQVASRRVVDAVASVGEILSREQRFELAEEARKHHGYHRWGRE